MLIGRFNHMCPFKCQQGIATIYCINNLAKMAVEQVFNKTGFAKSNGYTTAAGIFLKKSDISSPYGRAVGIIADNMVAVGLGVTCIYWLTLMGKDKYLLKGAGLGAAEWASLYGAVSRLGATAIFPVEPKGAIATFISHLVFGMTKITIAVKLGDSRLFKPSNLKEEIDEPQSLFANANTERTNKFSNIRYAHSNSLLTRT